MTSQPPGADAEDRAQRQAQTCAECGTRPSPGQSFCDGCGAVLRWTPAPAVNDRASEPDPEAAPSEGDPAHDSGARQPPEDAPTEPVPVANSDAASAADRAKALLVPVADREPQPEQTPLVEPVLPGRPVATRPLVQAPGMEPGDEGGTPCPWCGTGNHPDRHFCRRCAMTMAGRPEEPAPRPWWRRLLGPQNREAPWAGDRPRLRRGLDRVLTWTGAAVVLALLVAAALNAGTVVQSVRDHFTARAPVAPDSVQASHSFQGHDAKLVFDHYNNTWWGPGFTGSGAGEWLEAHFTQPTQLLNVIITSGESSQPGDQSKSNLPERIEAFVTAANGTTTSRFLDLDQKVGPQKLDFRADNVTTVRFVLRSAYGDNTRQVALAEIEFFGPSKAGGW